MSESPPQDSVLVHLEYLREGVDEIRLHLKELNGRTRANETDIAILKDRADESRTSGRRWGLTAGGVGSAIGATLAYLFRGSG